MPVPGVQVNLTLGVTVDLNAPITPAAGQSWSVEVANISPWTLLVNVSGKQYNLPPGVAQLYFSPSGPADVTATPSGPAITGTFYVISNWAVSPDSIPGTFPVVVVPALNLTNTTNNPVIVQVVQLPAPQSSIAFSENLGMTGAAQTLGAQALKVGLAFLSDPANAAKIYIGPTAVTTGSGYITPGQGIVVPGSNSNIFGVLGTAGDHLSIWGA